FLVIAWIGFLGVLAAGADDAVTKVRTFPRMKEHSIQGMGITADGYLIQGYDRGLCRIYDLKKEKERPIAEFPFGSAGKDNHANAIALGEGRAEGSDFPLVYVTGGQPANGIMECHVEFIGGSGGGYHARRIQRIVLSPDFSWDMKPS